MDARVKPGHDDIDVGGKDCMPSDFENLSAQSEPLRAQLTDLQGLADGFGRAMTTAFRRSVVDGKRLQDVLKSLALGLSSRALNQALAPIGQGIGNALSNVLGGLVGRGFAKGGVLGARVTPFASGGVIASPSFFPMRGGVGLAGEAGPEAILPLTRGADGRLGVRAQGGGALNVTFNVTTPDAASFRRAESEGRVRGSSKFTKGSPHHSRSPAFRIRGRRSGAIAAWCSTARISRSSPAASTPSCSARSCAG
jgi:hypothetical protein